MPTRSPLCHRPVILLLLTVTFCLDAAAADCGATGFLGDWGCEQPPSSAAPVITKTPQVEPISPATASLPDEPPRPPKSARDSASSAKQRLDQGIDWDYCGPRRQPGDFGGARSDTKIPVNITADSANLWREREVGVFTGEVQVQQGDKTLDAAWMRLDRKADRVEASGDVLLQESGLRVAGEEANLELGTQRGRIEPADFRLTKVPARGSAEQGQILDRHHAHFDNIEFTSCRPGQDHWSVKASELDIDTQESTGTAHHARLSFMDVPMFYLPYLSFPIGDKRKSGFLVPSFGSGSKTGLDISLPYYWNIAPDLDATLTPRLMSKRGLMLGGQLRYLTPSQKGELNAEIIPDDAEASTATNNTRGAFSFKQKGKPMEGLSSDINFNYASDNQYLEDFSNSLGVSSIRQLERRGDLLYNAGNWSLLGRAQYFQNLDPKLSSGERPYSRLPQILHNWDQEDYIRGLEYHMESEYVYFDHIDENKVQGQRLALRPWISLPLRHSYGSLIPKLQARFGYYDLVNTVPNQDRQPSILLPTFSLDGKLVFERDLDWFGTSALQTLEPRIYYLLTPYENQDEIPVFDTSTMDFMFASLFRDNRFAGRDRIGDANQLTLALTSRTLSDHSGHELLRLGIGQILFFRDRRVQLPGYPVEKTTSSPIATEIAAPLGGYWSTTGTLFWDPHYGGQTESAAMALRYQTPNQQIFNAGYLYNRGEDTTGTNTRVEDTDLSIRWPLFGNTHMVGRWRYSLFYGETMDGFVGFEYDRCCWLLRGLYRHYVTDVSKGANDMVMLQLELKGLGPIGNGIDAMLEKGILGYTRIDRVNDE